MNKPTVIFDACVLYPVHLRHLLMYLARANLFQAKWTDEIHDEWTRNVLKNIPNAKKERVQHIRDLMNQAVRDCLVTGYQYRIPDLNLPDQNDRHVLAAAIHAGASIIVTFNLRHFPEIDLNKDNVKARHPDDFIVNLIEMSHESVCTAVEKHRLEFKDPPISIEELLEMYGNQGLSKTVTQLKLYNELL